MLGFLGAEGGEGFFHVSISPPFVTRKFTWGFVSFMILFFLALFRERRATACVPLVTPLSHLSRAASYIRASE